MTKAEQLRQVTVRSKFLEYAKQLVNVSATCRHFGISREKFSKALRGARGSWTSGPSDEAAQSRDVHIQTREATRVTCPSFGISREKFYKWKRRFEELGAAGLADRPTRPHKSPNATPAAVVSKVLYLRQNYHFGAGRIRDYLKRFHGVRIAGAMVQSLLHKHGLGRLPANQKHQPHGNRWIRYEKPVPGHRIQMDVNASASLARRNVSISSRLSTTARASVCSRSATHAIKRPR